MSLLSRLFRKDATDTSSISFTAHYTGYVWYRNGLSAEPFRTPRGALYYALLSPFEAVGRQLAGGNIRDFLLQRHYVIDQLIARAIEDEGVTQVLEIACGLSPRGWRFCAKYPQLHYVEADLPDMARRKAGLLRECGALSERHRVVTCNILVDGDDSLEAVIAREFDTSKPLLVVTEGLVNYFDLGTISGFWQRLATVLRKFPAGIYLTDNYPLLDNHPFRRLLKSLGDTLGAASRSNVSFHFGSDAAMEAHFRKTGFRIATAHNPRDRYDDLPIPRTRGDSFVRVLEART
ncbi:MAG: class I SAM-dependent methyltransferase [Pseudomonadota bacterium]